MKKQKNLKARPVAKKFRRLLAAGTLLAIAFLAVGVVAGVSKRNSTPSDSKPEQNKTVTNTASTRTTNIQIADQSGQIRSLTPEEEQRLATALKALANRSADGLKQVRHPDGSVSMELQGRFQNVALAKRNEDGSVSQTCIDSPESGAVFFGIDPKLVGAKTSSGATTRSSSASM